MVTDFSAFWATTSGIYRTATPVKSASTPLSPVMMNDWVAQELNTVLGSFKSVTVSSPVFVMVVTTSNALTSVRLAGAVTSIMR